MNKSIILATTAIGLIASCGSAFAQDAAPSGNSVGEIVVTGSRLKTGFTQPTPVTVMSVQQLEAKAPTSIGEALATLPAFLSSQTTSKLGAASSAFGGAQALLNLRALGPGRTLILLNGERLPFTNVNGTVDTNVIPQALIQRVDVVTGGASASYGADAVAGVVNFVIDNRFNGLQVNAIAGETQYSDAKNAHFTIAGGRSFLGGKLHLEGSLEEFNQTQIGFGTNGRKWFDKATGFVTLPAGSPTTFGMIPDVRFSTMALGGLVTSVTSNTGSAIAVPGLSGMQLSAGAVPVPFDKGTFTGTSFQSGGDGPRAVNGLSPEQNRQSAFFRADYELSDSTSVFAEVMYSRSFSDAKSVDVTWIGSKAVPIFADNAYLTPSLKSLMTANNVAYFSLGRLNADLPALENRDTTTLMRADIGIKGQINPTWSYDAGFAVARSDQNFGEYLPMNRNVYAATDAVINPANGQVVCRSTLAGLDPGCVPINVLGPGTISKAGSDYIEAWDWGRTIDKQTVLTANVRGDLGTLNFGAGPISTAAGFTWRSDQAYRTVSPYGTITNSCAGLKPAKTGCVAYDGLYGGFPTYDPGALSGTISVAEAYGELGIPLLKDKPFIRSLDVDIAGRGANYSTSGMTYTWKIGPSWQVTDEFRIRATRSQDIRAPNINELFSQVASVVTQTSLLLPSSSAPGPKQTTTVTINTGNLNLKPEVAQTLTIGGVYRPNWMKGLQTSLDYYNIDLGQAIFSLSNQTIINNCAAGIQSYCTLITQNGVSVTSTAGLNGANGVSIKVPPANIGAIKVSGLDFEIADTLHPMGGRLDLRLVGNYALTFTNSSSVAPNGPILIGLLANAGGGTPQWSGTINQTWEHPITDRTSYVIGLEEQLIAGGKYNPNYTLAQLSAHDNTAPQITYLNMRAAYKFKAFGANQELSFNIDNVFDTSPPALPLATTYQATTNYNYYDVLGRRFTIGLKAKW